MVSCMDLEFAGRDPSRLPLRGTRWSAVANGPEDGLRVARHPSAIDTIRLTSDPVFMHETVQGSPLLCQLSKAVRPTCSVRLRPSS
jgi:hypothetical protein